MTDSNATELLRKLLDERGMEWKAGFKNVTWIGDWCFVEYDNGKLAATCEPTLTPEQAVAATLGAGECEIENCIDEALQEHNAQQQHCLACNDWFVLYAVDEDGWTYDVKPNFCPNCGKAVKR